MKKVWSPLTELCRLVAETFGHKNPELWPNGLYVKLGQDIFKKSGIVISTSTLKRIFGKINIEGSYDPQQETKNALAMYAGFGNWNDFLKKNAPMGQADSTDTKTKSKGRFNKMLLFFSVSLLVAVASWFVWNRFIAQWEVSVSAERSYSDAPFSNLFHIQSNVQFPSQALLVIEDDTIVLKPGMKNYTKFFKLPGLVHARVFVNGKERQCLPILVGSGGKWEGYAHADFETNNWVPSGTLSHTIFRTPHTNEFFSKEDIESFGLISNKYYLTEYRLFKKMGICMDTLSAEFSVLNKGSISAIFCDHVGIKLHCEGGIVGFRFVKGGCTRWSVVELGDLQLTGKDQDLQFMGQDFSRFRNVRIGIIGNHVVLSIDGKKIFESDFDNKLGQLYGLSFHFTGLGEFSDVRLQSGNVVQVIPSVVHQ